MKRKAKKQLTEITDENETVIRQITDNKVIAEIIENESIDQWKDVQAIQSTAEKSYIFTSYELIIEPAFQETQEDKIVIGMECLYLDGQDYYMETKIINNDIVPTYSKIPEKSGKYLEEIASETSQIQDKKDIFLLWGIEEDELEQSFLINSDDMEDTDVAEDIDYEKIPFSDIEEFDYAGVKATSKYERNRTKLYYSVYCWRMV